VAGFVLSAAWEFAHSPLYTDHLRGVGYVLWTRLHCTAGDVLILVVAFWVTGLVFTGRRWYERAHLWRVGTFTGLGLAYTAWSEWFNTTVRGTWAYTEAMPTVFGLGLTPLLQWTVLPPVVVLILRKVAPSHGTEGHAR